MPGTADQLQEALGYDVLEGDGASIPTKLRKEGYRLCSRLEKHGKATCVLHRYCMVLPSFETFDLA